MATWWPKLRERRTSLTFGSRSAIVDMTSHDPSWLPSST